MRSSIAGVWTTAALGECAAWMSGGTPSTREATFWGGEIPWITSSSLKGFFLKDSERRVTVLGAENGTRIVPDGTTIFVVRGMSLRNEWRVGITTRPMAFGQDCKALIPDNRFDPLFFAYATKSVSNQVLRLVERAGHGTGRLSTGPLKQVRIPVPPLPEQRAIAEALRTVQQAKEATNGVIAAARELKKSLMRHLFTFGPVTPTDATSLKTTPTDWGEVRSDWSLMDLDSVAVVSGGKRLPKGHSFSEEITPWPYIRVTDFGEGRIDNSQLRYLTSEDHSTLARYTVEVGDVCVSIAGSPGLVIEVDKSLDSAHLTENAARIALRRDAHLTSRFLRDSLNSPGAQYQMVLKTTRSTQPKLALSRLRTVLIPVPPAVQQTAITGMLDAVDRKIAAEEANRDSLGVLFDSLLHDLMTAKLRMNDLEVVA